ncbi:hypothetical protein [Tsukamurella pseudospumae]|uniref:Uncharacterized protein n=1 Tax=Tsukamurella pseudospumae TaxID=239498 RepID=A0A138AEC0_9ACTN|nr:hypothetical protein [Tsukamurella pseudospumae]KXP08717.1 hypothetical protein AXK60_08565 [Tsukamurella pseudospumae]
MDDVRVYLRDLRSKEWIRYTAEEWITQYYARIEDALCEYRDTFGGSLGLTGTIESGRLTVCDANDKVVLDFDWRTEAVDSTANGASRSWR